MPLPGDVLSQTLQSNTIFWTAGNYRDYTARASHRETFCLELEPYDQCCSTGITGQHAIAQTWLISPW